MTDPNIENANDPDIQTDYSPLDFNGLNVETTAPLADDFTAPNVKGSQPRWWERAPKSGKKTRTGKAKSAPGPAPAMPRGGLKGPLTNVYTGIGMSVMPFDPSCGRMIIENAEKCASALDELARTNPAVRRVLLSLVTTSAWGAVVMAHAPILMAIAMHHVPVLKERQEKLVGEFAEMMANGFGEQKEGEDK